MYFLSIQKIYTVLQSLNSDTGGEQDGILKWWDSNNV